MNQIFYLHPHKCGGKSVQFSLEKANLPYLRTHLINFDTDIRLSGIKVITGHSHDIPHPPGEHGLILRSKFVNYLYFKCDLIVPLRHPANILQSWMHYHVRSINEIIAEGCARKIKACKMHRISSLKQSSVTRVDGNKYEMVGKLVKLNSEDEEENLFRFVECLIEEGDSSSFMLRTLEHQLFYPTDKILLARRAHGVKYCLKPPLSGSGREIFYYDCENKTQYTFKTLERLLGAKFVSSLSRYRINRSTPSQAQKASRFTKFASYLEDIIPNEFVIYSMAHGGS